MHKRSDTPTDNDASPIPEATWPQKERRRFPRNSEETTEPIALLSAAPPIPCLSFSTLDLPRPEQFNAWLAYMRPIINVRLPDHVIPEDGFIVTHTVWHLGKMLLVQQSSDAYNYERTETQLRHSPIDHWYLGLRHNGEAWTESDGKVIKTGSGRIAFRSLGYPYRGRCTQSEITLLYIPYSLFSSEAALLKLVNNSILTGTLAELLAHYLTQLETRLPVLTLNDLPGIVQTIKNMVVSSLEVHLQAAQQQPKKNGFAMMERIHHYIHHNLHDLNLSAEKVCRSVGISRTRLYQLFEGHGGVLNYIRRQRLLEAYERLQDPTNQDRILDIAQTSGFDAASNFTRAFIHAFGVSPRDVRKKIIQTDIRGDQLGSLSESKQLSFENWLCNLDL